MNLSGGKSAVTTMPDSGLCQHTITPVGRLCAEGQTAQGFNTLPGDGETDAVGTPCNLIRSECPVYDRAICKTGFQIERAIKGSASTGGKQTVINFLKNRDGEAVSLRPCISPVLLQDCLCTDPAIGLFCGRN